MVGMRAGRGQGAAPTRGAVTIWEARWVRALDASRRWYAAFVWCRLSGLPRARRHALRCRVCAVVVFDRWMDKSPGRVLGRGF